MQMQRQKAWLKSKKRGKLAIEKQNMIQDLRECSVTAG